MYLNIKNTFIFFLILLISYFIACAPQKKHNTLTFFFDGVPDLELEVDTNIRKTELQVEATTVILPVHAPYQEKKCEKCHDYNNLGGMHKPQPELCYQCHDNFNDQFNALHGPADGGYCTDCHSPHKSKEEKLLLHPDIKLCYTCHDSILTISNRFHKKTEELNCTNCHNPHGGENRYMFKKGTCYKCHDDYNKSYSLLHGPVNGEYCTSCHSSHNSKNQNLLSRIGNQVCLHCHNELLVLQNKNHKNKDVKCTDCHNPHGGENRFFTKL